ncbi:helix-turn-helix domain-containing protein [Nocardiopsis synnemataformans]|uniref:helix-turn-helix domain-containing protein n=1 Tax=Nocardiopsis synnemataformans TaxID=61305 RepID=UPI003EBCFF08
MDNRDEVRAFLMSRRARLTPPDVGLPDVGRRRVPGLRREEVAILAGVSSEYYAQLERGNLTGVSDSVLDALSRALRLDEVEQLHLFNLARAASGPRRPRRAPAPRIRPSVQRLLDTLTGTPALVRNDRLDIVAANPLGQALLAPVFAQAAATPGRLPNTARYAFLDPTAREFYADWDGVAHDGVAALRAHAGKNPHDRALTDLIGELSTRSHEFRQLWATYDVTLHRSGAKRLMHPVVGELVLDFDSMALTQDEGLTFVTYSAAPDSPSAETLALLASWAVTTRPGHPAADSAPNRTPER